jgi:histidyl-tRNA synthetase
MTMLLESRGKSSGLLKDINSLFNQNLSELESPLSNFITIMELLEALDINCCVDITSGRGFEYYTGIIFRLFYGEGHVGGGGRYDALIPLLGGHDVSASGFALYLDHLMNIIESQALTVPQLPGVLVKTEIAQGTLPESLSLIDRLHEEGYMAEFYLGGPEPADRRWHLQVELEAPQLILTDNIDNKQYRLSTVAELVALLAAHEV